MARRAAVALITAGVIALSGCTDDVATEPDEPHELAPSQPPVEEPLVTVDTYPAVVNPSVLETAPGAATVTVTDPATELHATWPRLGLASLDGALQQRVDARVQAYQGAQDDAADQELNVTWSLVGSSDDVVGVLTEYYAVEPTGSRETWATQWYDAASDAVVPNTALVDDVDALASAVTEALEDQASVDADTLAAALVQGAPVMAFTENGELFVGFDEMSIAPTNTGRINVVLPGETTEELLSDLGEQARDALVSPGAPPLPPGTVPPVEDEEDGASEDADGAADEPTAAETGEPVDCTVEQCVALAFDGGPDDRTTAVLDALAEDDAPATFFVLGQQAATYPEATAAIGAAGHEIGAHSWSHRNLTRLPLPELDGELRRSVEVVEDAAGTTPTLLLAPYAAADAGVQRRAATAGLTIVEQAAPDADASAASAEDLTAQALAGAQRGSVVTLPGAAAATPAAVPTVVAALREQGFTLVTVSELSGDTGDGGDGAAE
ncbi:polysaccharide deacetylase family protein [Nocardioides zeae]|uniref:Polysaccharide deacetylase family protein n=1 Tax=Nocardioides imazamoxiresistens TaxID=3231893 RepID=A0ABU3PVX9_9ACTN|nr:polysaccharide deacetylase family protein [Nocardioides zeae]MDT9593395.1 polysaccharide deacetylase family protein [Nocardioides zeae]